MDNISIHAVYWHISLHMLNIPDLHTPTLPITMGLSVWEYLSLSFDLSEQPEQCDQLRMWLKSKFRLKYLQELPPCHISFPLMPYTPSSHWIYCFLIKLHDEITMVTTWIWHRNGKPTSQSCMVSPRISTPQGTLTVLMLKPINLSQANKVTKYCTAKNGENGHIYDKLLYTNVNEYRETFLERPPGLSDHASLGQMFQYERNLPPPVLRESLQPMEVVFQKRFHCIIKVIMPKLFSQ